MAYAVSYDWSQGCRCELIGKGNNILIHQTTEEEVKPRDKAKK